jgi:hypothetical protein
MLLHMTVGYISFVMFRFKIEQWTGVCIMHKIERELSLEYRIVKWKHLRSLVQNKENKF